MQVGQHVACGSSGAFAEYVIANAASCYPVREASAEAVGVSLSGLTAAAALEVGAGILTTGHQSPALICHAVPQWHQAPLCPHPTEAPA